MPVFERTLDRTARFVGVAAVPEVALHCERGDLGKEVDRCLLAFILEEPNLPQPRGIDDQPVRERIGRGPRGSVVSSPRCP